jgi:5-methylcytosine-specific restriction protein A
MPAGRFVLAVMLMPMMPPTHRINGREGPKDQRSRGNARQRGYDAEWQRASAAHLRVDPLCRYCALDTRVRAATLVDHLYPHRGDRALFWLRLYWISSCSTCHSGMKQSVERQGRAALDALAARLALPKLQGVGG